MPKLVRRSPLEKIERQIAECREIIANKQAEIRELETAAIVLRRIEGVPAEQSFAGKKIRECCRILLGERSPRHFKELAREAFARGYVSQKGGDIEVVSRSFWTTLRAFPGDFKAKGPGLFELVKKEGDG